ncbi:hypothetical protein EFY79_16740 [Hanamia caeni]|uniref:Uncharacterized protein n=1 Tax=Hanamia caeni TaxID=2294116 RepID=A0A3M9N890_9BACT|nr:hypothetical protein EFY79_16740 [Hanamia caeni]
MCNRHIRIYAKSGRSAKIEHWRIFQQQLRAEESLCSNRNNNQLFIINLVTVPADRNSNSRIA